MQSPWRLWKGIVLLSAGLITLRSDNLASIHSQSHRMQHLPRLTVWVWERREDLRTLDPAIVAVAWLDRTITLDVNGLTVEPRHQPLLLPASTALTRIPVVRIEIRNSSELNEASAQTAAEAILQALDPHTAALQIDFDARRSQRDWYRDVLTRVRRSLPADIPLSITALASWCSYDNTWLHTLPVDEAVPMLFRMEPDRRSAAALGQLSSPELTIHEPLCADSVGISTHERWPMQLANKRIYVFPDSGWQQDNLKETVKQLW
jgi:hypothetical protein